MTEARQAYAADWKEPNTVSSLVILGILTLACLLPFIGKAFHIDDPLYVWTARHIQSDPLNFYGFKVNWYGREELMGARMDSPPLIAYYMVPVGALFGWNETALHVWFLLPALALVAGAWFLARSFVSHPLAAALVVITAPVFLLSSTNVMCDTMMMALWVWAIGLWMAGLRQNSQVRLCAAAVLISASALTKYFGLALLPLLLIYSLMERKRVGRWIAWLLIPLVVMALYQWMTRRLYGQGMLAAAAARTSEARAGANIAERFLTGLAFSGGCVFILVPLAPFLWGRKALAGGIVAVILTGLFFVALKNVNHFPLLEEGRVKWLFVAQFSCMVVAGASLIVLAVADWWEERTPISMLLLLWLAGTFLFDSVVTWMESGRYVLPMIPAAALLLVRRLERRNSSGRGNIMGRLWVPLGLSLAVALLASWADFRLANSARDAAAIVRHEAGAAQVWFESHWGFQYYMEQQGARPIGKDHLTFSEHDVIAMPAEGTDAIELPMDRLGFWFKVTGHSLPCLTVMSLDSGAGFYSSRWGPLPFVFCHAPADEYVVFRVQ